MTLLRNLITNPNIIIYVSNRYFESYMDEKSAILDEVGGIIRIKEIEGHDPGTIGYKPQ